MLRILIYVVVCFFTTKAIGEGFEAPTKDDLDRSLSQAVDALSKANSLSTNKDFNADIARAREGLRSTIPNYENENSYKLDHIERLNSIGGLPIDDILAGSHKVDVGQQSAAIRPLVLVSLGMPKPLLKALIEEAGRYGAPVIIRGFYKNDIKKTISYIKVLTNGSSPGISIDPTIFSRFEVTSVPSFILPLEHIEACDNSGCKAPEHVKSRGNSSLEYFLRAASRLGGERASEISDAILLGVDNE